MDYSVTLDTVVEATRKVVDTAGRDFVYNPAGGLCRYDGPADSLAVDPSCGCMVGRVLHSMGVDVSRLCGGAGDLQMDFDVFANWEPRIFEFFNVAQKWQDSGRPWGFALDKALTSVGLG